MAERTRIHCDYSSCNSPASIRVLLTDPADVYICGQGNTDDSGQRDLCKAHFAQIMGLKVTETTNG